MAKNKKWQDDDWLLLMQAYLHRPVGLKPVYSRVMVQLALELHIQPESLAVRMQQIAKLDKPRIERIWQTYANSPGKLSRAVKLLRAMKGFGRADEFYDGVEINETWERDWTPLAADERLTPVVLTLVLDLYFRLTPATMVRQTPEVQELARLVHISADDVVDILDVFQHCDPYLNRRDVTLSELLQPCQQVWQRYGNGDPQALATLADHLKVYYLS
jgi:hypothetical protein